MYTQVKMDMDTILQSLLTTFYVLNYKSASDISLDKSLYLQFKD